MSLFVYWAPLWCWSPSPEANPTGTPAEAFVKVSWFQSFTLTCRLRCLLVLSAHISPQGGMSCSDLGSLFLSRVLWLESAVFVSSRCRRTPRSMPPGHWSTLTALQQEKEVVSIAHYKNPPCLYFFLMVPLSSSRFQKAAWQPPMWLSYKRSALVRACVHQDGSTQLWRE